MAFLLRLPHLLPLPLPHLPPLLNRFPLPHRPPFLLLSPLRLSRKR